MPNREHRPDEEILRRLDELERSSRERTSELRAIAAQLPAVVGRRAMVRTLVGDALANADKREVLRRAGLKLARIPRRVTREVRHGLATLGAWDR